MKALAGQIVKLAGKKQWKIALAESCSGGMIASEIVGVKNASKVFLGSIVCYSNYAKIHILKVDEDIINEHSAVSKECSLAMAEGLFKVFEGVDLVLSITGYLDYQESCPDLSGKVFISVGTRCGIYTRVIDLDVEKGRNFNREFLAREALGMLLSELV